MHRHYILYDTYWIASICSSCLVFWIVRVLGIHSVICGTSLTRKHIINAISTHHLVCRHSNCHPSCSSSLQIKLNGVSGYHCPLHISCAASPLTVGRHAEHSLTHKRRGMQWCMHANKERLATLCLTSLSMGRVEPIPINLQVGWLYKQRHFKPVGLLSTHWLMIPVHPMLNET